ncbi:MAG: AAA family ATPase [Rubrobacteraceae bacterium]|nr:AAA family ATPase [Rubrobacteraceae bacterium]
MTQPKSARDAENGADPLRKLIEVEEELNVEVLEREDEVKSLVLALIAGEHVLLLGSPGTAKSALSRALCERIEGGSYFSVLLTRHATPALIFGPDRLSALQEDRYEQNTEGMLPEATIAFIDEIFKSNSSVLNGMLPILNERLYKNGSKWQEVPLQMAVGASNEMPEDREELGALYDRFLIRHLVEPVRQEKSFEAILLRKTGASGRKTTLSLEEILAARGRARKVDLSAVVPQIIEVRGTLAEEGIEPSVRRFDKGGDLVRSAAYLAGRELATEEDLAPLAHVLWEDPEQVSTVRDAILCRANPYLKEAQDLLDEGEEVAQNALAADELERSSRGAEANRKLKAIQDKLLTLRGRASDSGRSAGSIDAALTAIKDKNREILGRCLGVDGT